MKLLTLSVLSDEEIETIHQASLRILAETGVIIGNQRIRHMLREAGASVDPESHLVRIPEDLTAAALKTAPSRIRLYNRDGELAATLGDGSSYVGCGGDAIYFQDLETGERRPATKSDLSDLVRLAGALDRFSVVFPPALPHDVSPRSCYLHAADAVFGATTKHLYIAPETAPVARAILEMARVVASTRDLSVKPIVTFQFSIQSPLTWSEDLGNMVLLAAQAGIPMCFHTAPFAGVSCPTTLAGLLAMHNAEVLSAVVISQVAREGTPVICGGGWGSFDLRYATRVLSSPEGALLRIAGLQITRSYGKPSHCIGPDTDSHCYDEQNGWEKMLTAIATLASGVSLMINSSMFGTAMTVSLEQLLLDHEILAIAFRLLQGIEVNPETIALDVIKKVCPYGNFLMEDHTLKYMRSGEHWYPDISNRLTYDQWQEQGALTVVEQAHEAAVRILQSHHAQPLDAAVQRELSQLIEAFESESAAAP